MEELITYNQNKHLQKPPLSLSIDNKSIIKSRSFPKISELSDKEIKKLFILIFSLIGIKSENMPDQLQEKILIYYIRENLKKYTIQEFRIAFVLGIKGKLDYNVQSYQNFNILYLENVMQSYSRYVFNLIRESENKPPKKVSPEKQKEILKNLVIDFFEKFKKDQEIRFSLTNVSYDYLDNLKLLNITIEEKQKYYKKAESIIKNQLILKKSKLKTTNEIERKNYNDILSNFTKRKCDFKTKIKNKAKEIALRDFLLKQIYNKKEIKDLINEAGKNNNCEPCNDLEKK